MERRVGIIHLLPLGGPVTGKESNSTLFCQSLIHVVVVCWFSFLWIFNIFSSILSGPVVVVVFVPHCLVAVE